MNVLIWHVHGSWMTAFVQGPHRYLVPVVPDRGPAGRGRARSWTWPESVVECTPDRLADEPIDVVIVQRPEELELAARWLGGRQLGRELPFVYLEHNAPQGRINDMVHPMADRDDVTLVHVTPFNALFWDSGSTAVEVVEHGIVDPGLLYTGERESAAVVINEPVRRGRVTGTDLLPTLSAFGAIELYGMGSEAYRNEAGADVTPIGDPIQGRLHEAIAGCRLYLHPVRWTSLGLSLVEAMHLGMPVVALATTQVAEAVPPGAGVVSNRIEVLGATIRRFLSDPDEARACGIAGRAGALERFGLTRFLDDWDRVLKEVAS
jgi:glycosyltransferase involved in cell wall biosynthesis